MKICSRLEKSQAIYLMDVLQDHEQSIKQPQSIGDLAMLESIYDLCGMYLWMSIRSADKFVNYDDAILVREGIEKWISEFMRRNSQAMLSNETVSSLRKPLKAKLQQATGHTKSKSNHRGKF